MKEEEVFILAKNVDQIKFDEKPLHAIYHFALIIVTENVYISLSMMTLL